MCRMTAVLWYRIVLMRKKGTALSCQAQPLVMLSTFAALSVNSAKHLAAPRARPFAAFRVTIGGTLSLVQSVEGEYSPVMLSAAKHLAAPRGCLVNRFACIPKSHTYRFCISRSSLIPCSASMTRSSIVARLKTPPSPVPCTSINSCSAVITTLKSTSACESSS